MTGGTVQLDLLGRPASGCLIFCYRDCTHAHNNRCTLASGQAHDGKVGSCGAYHQAKRPAGEV